MKTKSLLFFVLFLFLTKCSNKENDTIATDYSLNDSLTYCLEKANDDNLTILFKKKYNNKALEIVQRQTNDSSSRANLFKVANRFFNINDWQSFKNVSKEVLEKSLEKKDTILIAKSYS